MFCSISFTPTVVPENFSSTFSGTDNCGLASYTAVITCPVGCSCTATTLSTSGSFTFNANCPSSSQTISAAIQGETQIIKSQSVTFTGLTISAFKANTASSFSVTVTLSTAGAYHVILTCSGCTCPGAQDASSGTATFAGVTCSATGSPSFTATLQENTAITTSLAGSIFSLSKDSPTSPIYKNTPFTLTILAAVSGTGFAGVTVLLASYAPCTVGSATAVTDGTGKATFAVTCATEGSYTFTVADNLTPATTTNIQMSIYKLAISYDSATVRPR